MGFEQRPFWQREPSAGIGAEMALRIAACEFRLNRADLVSRRRSAELVRARAFVTWALRTLGTPLSYPKIGLALGGRDHSTVIHLHQKAIGLRLTDAGFADCCDRLAKRFCELREYNHGE